MSNETLWCLYLLFDFGAALLAMIYFGRLGLYAIIIASLIICNIQVQKIITLFGVSVTLGNIAYGGTFLATDLLSEVYGKNEAKKAVCIGFLTLFVTTIALQLSLLFTPGSDDIMHPHMHALFTMAPRIFLASLIAYMVSQFHDVWAYHYWKIKTKDKYLWWRNNASTFVSQTIDSMLFVTIAFYGTYSRPVIINIFFTTLICKWLIAVLDTPFVYLGKWVLEQRTKRAFGHQKMVVS